MGRAVLLVVPAFGFAHDDDAVIARLVDGGHRVVIARTDDRATDVSAPDREPDRWTDLRLLLRRTQNYLRHFLPGLRQAAASRQRTRQELPAVVAWLVRVIACFGPGAIRRAAGVMVLLERSIPVSTSIIRFVQQADVDVLLTAVPGAASHAEYIRAAQRLGVPTGLCVASPDVLATTAALPIVPDRLFVWNETQKCDAVAWHRVPASRVVVTGAPQFDAWFDAVPRRSRAEFCRHVGVPADRPFILYVGASSSGPHEAVLVERWIRAVRGASDSVLNRAGILIRPHPDSAAQFMAADFTVFGDVVLWPPFQADWLDPLYEADDVDAVYHCAATVGLSENACIGSMIAGRPVYTLPSRAFGDHLERLARTMREAGDERSTARVAEFVRPVGMDRSAGALLADAIAAMPVSPRDRHSAASIDERSGRPAAVAVAAFVAAMVRRDDDRPWWNGVVPLAVTIWIALVRVQLAIADSTASRHVQQHVHRLRAASRHRTQEMTLALQQISRGMSRAGRTGWKRLVRRVRLAGEGRLTFARKRVQRFFRGAPKQMRRRARSAVRAVRRRLPHDPSAVGRHRGE